MWDPKKEKGIWSEFAEEEMLENIDPDEDTLPAEDDVVHALEGQAKRDDATTVSPMSLLHAPVTTLINGQRAPM